MTFSELRAARSLWLTALVGLMASCGVTGGGFQDPQTPTSDTTRVEGQALTAEGIPAPLVQVYLLHGGRRVTQGLTAEDGRFSLQTNVVGRSTLVLNDGAGVGAFRELNVYADGVNRVGDVFMELLEDLPRIVDLHGVGFEERLSTEAGNYLYPQYSSDASFVYAMRKKDGEDTHDIVRISTADGSEEVLLQDQAVSTNSYRLALFADRILRFQVLRPSPDNPEYREYFRVFYDLNTRTELASFQASKLHFGGFSDPEGIIVLLEKLEERRLDNGFSDDYVWRLRPIVIDAVNAQIRTGDTLPATGGWVTQLAFTVLDGQRLVYAPVRYCQIPDEHPNYCDGWEASMPLYQLDLNTLTGGYLGALPGVSAQVGVRAQASKNGRHFVYVSDSGLQLYDLTTDTARMLQALSCAGRCTQEFKVSPQGDRLVLLKVETDDMNRPLSTEWSEVLLSSGAATGLPTVVSIDGTSHTVCEPPFGSCTAEYDGQGRPVLWERGEASGGQNHATSLTVASDGSTSGQRFTIGERDGYPLVMQKSGVEVALLRDLQTGFKQIYVQSASGLQKKTFITAQHRNVAISSDGSKLFYFTRDPISGFEQLFRVVLAP